MRGTLIRVDTGAPFVADCVVQSNADGSTSFVLPAGGYAGQEPMLYGERHDQGPNTGPPQQYQRFTLTGNVVVSLTRPEDPPFVYLFGQGQVYPA